MRVALAMDPPWIMEGFRYGWCRAGAVCLLLSYGHELQIIGLNGYPVTGSPLRESAAGIDRVVLAVLAPIALAILATPFNGGFRHVDAGDIALPELVLSRGCAFCLGKCGSEGLSEDAGKCRLQYIHPVVSAGVLRRDAHGVDAERSLVRCLGAPIRVRHGGDFFDAIRDSVSHGVVLRCCGLLGRCWTR